MNLLNFNNWIKITESSQEFIDYSKNNLNVTQYRNGDPIPEVKDPREWSVLTTGAFCYYNNDPENGILYNWLAVNDPRGLAPIGWKIPSIEELMTYDLSSNYENVSRNIQGEYRLSNNYHFLWSSTDDSSKNAWYQTIDTSSNHKEEHLGHYLNGISVRCIPDNDSALDALLLDF